MRPLAEDEPHRAQDVIEYSIPTMTAIMKLFAPAGRPSNLGQARCIPRALTNYD